MPTMSDHKTDASDIAHVREDEEAEHTIKRHRSRDVALELVDMVVATEFTKEEERSTARRIDMVLVPVMFVTFALQYMDKACLTGAALFGILPDLGLVQM